MKKCSAAEVLERSPERGETPDAHTDASLNMRYRRIHLPDKKVKRISSADAWRKKKS